MELLSGGEALRLHTSSREPLRDLFALASSLVLWQAIGT